MSAKQYFKSVGLAIIEPAYKALVKSYPNYAPGVPMSLGKTFRWSLNGNTAYNNKIFYAAQNILVRKLTEAPITFSQKKTGSKVKFDRYYSKAITNEKRSALKALALTELEEHDLNRLFDNPNGYQSGIELMEDFWHWYGFGNGYLWFETLGEGTRNKSVVHIHCLPSCSVEVVESNNYETPVKEYVYTTRIGLQLRIPPEQILHLKHWNNTPGSLEGLGVDTVAAMDISLNNSNNVAQGAVFINGGRGTLFSSDIGVDKDGEVVEKMTAEQMEALRETMQRELVGAHNNRKMYYTNGFISAQNFGDSMAEMELISAETNNWKSIFAICGIPVALAPITEASTENNVKAGYKALVTNLIVSELRKFDQKLTQKAAIFYPNDKIIAAHDLTEYTELAPDLEIMKNVYGMPSLMEDERRAIFGYDELPDGLGQVVLVATGLMKLEDIVNDEFAGAGNPNDNLEEL